MRKTYAVMATVAACLLASTSAEALPWVPVPYWPGKASATYAFESPDIPTGSWNIFGSIPYWTPTNNCGIEVQDNVAGAPREGGQFIELNSNCPSGIQQTMDFGNAQRYVDVSFYFSPRPYTPWQDNVMQVLWDGQVVTVQTTDNRSVNTIGMVAGGPTTSWSYYRLRVGNVPAGTHTLAFRSLSPWPTSVGGYLDYVTVEREVACDDNFGTWCLQGTQLPDYPIP